MPGIFYVSIKHQGRCSRYSRTFPGVSMQCVSCTEQRVESLHRNCPARTLATCWELLFATFTSLICSAYAIRHENGVSKPQRIPISQADKIQGINVPDSGLQIQLLEVVPSGNFEWILDPPPALMLFACLVLGCSISSFAYRRQDGDKFQTPIFALAIMSATIFGLAMGVNANVIMLGVIPWALCLAMIGSVAVHWLIRRCSRDRKVLYTKIHCCDQSEKEAPVPEAQPC
jgi:hypothetical protein